MMQKMSYLKEKYPGLYLDGYKNYAHIKDVGSEFCLGESEGQCLFEDGILWAIKDKESFLEIMVEAELALGGDRAIATFVSQFPCAYTVSYVLWVVGKKLDLFSVEFLFKNIFAQGNVISQHFEQNLYNLGFNYFLKQQYLAPKGAIGFTYPRNKQGYSGHVFFITLDGQYRTEFPNPNNLWDHDQGNIEIVGDEKYQIRDLAAENLHYFDHIYMPHKELYTDGFWLPPGIYPLERKD